MKTAVLEYRRLGILRRKVRMIPETWTELTPEQFVLVAELYLQRIKSQQFLAAFFRLPVQRLDEYQLYNLTKLTEFISDCRTCLDHFILPELEHLQSPGVRLKGMTFEHFMQVDTAFNRYARAEKPELLDRFIALLYLRKGESIVLPPSHRKGVFSHTKVLNLKRRIQEVASIDPAKKYAVFLNYVFIKRWLSRSFPWLFPLSNKEPGQGDQKKRPVAPLVNWLDIFDAFVGDNVAQMDKFQQMPATTAFRLLNKKIRDAQTKKK